MARIFKESTSTVNTDSAVSKPDFHDPRERIFNGRRVAENQNIVPMLFFEETPPLPNSEMGWIRIAPVEVFILFYGCSVDQLIVTTVYLEIVVQGL